MCLRNTILILRTCFDFYVVFLNRFTHWFTNNWTMMYILLKKGFGKDYLWHKSWQSSLCVFFVCLFLLIGKHLLHKSEYWDSMWNCFFFFFSQERQRGRDRQLSWRTGIEANRKTETAVPPSPRDIQTTDKNDKNSWSTPHPGRGLAKQRHK